MNDFLKVFRDAISSRNIDTSKLHDIILSVILVNKMNQLSEVKDKKYDTDKFFCSLDEETRQLLGFPIADGIQPLEKVRTFRILCDSLYVYFKMSGDVIDGTYLICKQSHFVLRAVGINYTRHGVDSKEFGNDEVTCRKMMDLYNSVQGFESEFKFIEKYLCKLKELDDKLGKRAVFKIADFSTVWLPKKYKSYGFNVSREKTHYFEGLNKTANISTDICLVFVGVCLQAFIDSLIDEVSDNEGMYMYYRFLDIEKGGYTFPLGNLNNIRGIRVPSYTKESLNAMRNRIFNSSPIYRSPKEFMEDIIGATKAVLDIEEG